MHPSVSSASRDVARICARCRLRAARTSPSMMLARPQVQSRTSPPWASIQATRAFSQSLSLAKPANEAAAATAESSSPTPPQTHYDLFPITLPSGPPPAGHFPIDPRVLRREFLQLQARAHPDLHPAEHKARAEATSALINEAYRTLANPLLRAQYLLSLRGVDVAQDETLKVEEPGLLMQVLEAREEIEDAQDEADLEESRTINDERIAASEAILEKAFQEDNVEAAKREAVRLRYWVNIKESLDNWERGKPIVLEH